MKTLKYFIFMTFLSYACTSEQLTIDKTPPRINTVNNVNDVQRNLIEELLQVEADSSTLLLVSVAREEYYDGNGPFTILTDAKIIVWPNDGNTLVIDGVENAIKGVAFDESSDSYVQTHYMAFSHTASFSGIPPGKYLVCVLIEDHTDITKSAFNTIELVINQANKVGLQTLFDVGLREGSFKLISNN